MLVLFRRANGHEEFRDVPSELTDRPWLQVDKVPLMPKLSPYTGSDIPSIDMSIESITFLRVRFIDGSFGYQEVVPKK